MSTSYWVVSGVGICTDEIRDHINKRKAIEFLLTQLPDDEELLEWKKRRDLKNFDIDDFLYGNPFENLADLLTHCDDTDTLTYGDAEGCDYFYYPPTMPWYHRDNEPKTVEEVHERIIDAVMVITDLSEVEIERMIDDDIYAVGCG